MERKPPKNLKREKASDPLLEAMHSFDEGLKEKPVSKDPKKETTSISLLPKSEKDTPKTEPRPAEEPFDEEILEKGNAPTESVVKTPKEKIPQTEQKSPDDQTENSYYNEATGITTKILERGITEYHDREGKIWHVGPDGNKIHIDVPASNATEAQETTNKTEKTEKLAKQIIKKAKDILKNLPPLAKILKKTPTGQIEKERKIQEDPKIKEEELAKMQEDLKRAEDALAEAQGEKAENLQNKKEYFYKNKWLQVGALTALLATDVDIAGKNLGWWGNNTPTGKIEEKNTAKKETGGIYTSPVTNLSAEAAKLKEKAEENERIEKIKADMQAKFDAESAKIDTAFSNKLAEVETVMKSTPAAPQKNITKEELLAGIEQKIMRAIKEGKNPNLTSDEATMWNMHLINQPTVIHTGETMQIGQKEQASQPTKTPYEPPMGAKVTSVGEGGVNYVFNSNPNGINFDSPARINTEETHTDNPFHLTPKMLEKVEEVYENNIEKIFPNDTLQNWRGVKDKNADEFMGKPESKIKKIQKPLYDYLKKLEDVTKLKPKSGILRDKPESIEGYIERALQKVAQDGKLDTVELEQTKVRAIFQG